MLRTGSSFSGDIFDEWPLLRERQPAEWAFLVHALKDKGKLEAALRLARHTVHHPACDGKARQLIAQAFKNMVPQWHWSIVQDARRNAAYDAALRRAAGAGGVVLDIGAGSGLLGMMAARAGADSVISCEMNPVTAFVAEEIVRHNGFSDRVRVVSRHSSALTVGPGCDLEQPADIIVSEIVSHSLLGQGVLPVHADAVPRLLRPGGRVIPAVGEIIVALGWYPPIQKYTMGTYDGFDLSPFNIAAPPHTDIKINKDISITTEPGTLFRFDFSRPDSWPGLQASVDVTARPGTANTVLQWIRLILDDSGAPDSVYESKPDPDGSSCWAVVMAPLPAPRTLAGGERLRIAGLRSETSLMVWLE